MIIVGERYQTVFNLQTKFRGGSGDNIIAFMTESGIKNINENLTNRTFNLPATNNNTFVYNLQLYNRNIVTGSDYNSLSLITKAYNQDYNEDYN